MIVKIDDKIQDEKLLYDINGEAPEIIFKSFHRYEYLTGEEVYLLIETKNRSSQIYLFSFRQSFGKTNK